jgi:hypothetical protein
MVEKDAPATWTNEDEQREHRIHMEEERELAAGLRRGLGLV